MTPSTPQAALTRLRDAATRGELTRLCRAHGLRLLVVFGSAADPATAGSAGDLDLAFWPRDGVDLLRLHDDLHALTGFDGIDLLDLSRAGVVARAQALGRGWPLYEAEAHLFAEEQVTALVRRLDTQWLRDLELDVLAER